MITSFNRLPSSMVVDNLDIMRVMPDPPEADAPLVIDPDAHLSGALAFQRFEPVSRRVPQVLDRPRRIQLAQLLQCPILNVARKFPARLAPPYAHRLFALERLDHQ
jgi:hypothetical protein